MQLDQHLTSILYWHEDFTRFRAMKNDPQLGYLAHSAQQNPPRYVPQQRQRWNSEG